MVLDLEDDEVKFLMSVLGELPTRTGAFVLLQKIATQVNGQGETTGSKKDE